MYCNVLISQTDNYNTNGLSIGVVPSALMNYWTGFQAEINYGFLDYYEFSLNIGAISSIKKNTVHDGYRFRPSLKYYFLKDKEDKRVYAEVGYLRRVTDEQHIDSYNMFQGAFRQEILNNRRKTLNGIFGMIGIREQYFSHLYLDAGIGVGIGYMNVELDKIDNAELIPKYDFYAYNSEGRNLFPILMFHLAVGYDF
jgi:hypothetical protein